MKPMLRIHNSLTGRKEPFEPLEPGEVGHVRLRHHRLRLRATSATRASLIAFDVCAGAGCAPAGYRVTYVRNITDIDDKIIAPRARERRADRGADRALHPRRWTRTARRSASRSRDHEPRATGTSPQIIDDDRAPGRAGLRLRRGERRRVLRGRAASRPTAGCPASSSPTCAPARASRSTRRSATRSTSCCGSAPSPASRPGTRPGARAGRAGTSSARRWRSRCSGRAFDIHGGGMDLKFPHHENEIAQSCAACDAPFANVWMHNGFVRVDDEKMSKSLGNFFTVREVLPSAADPEVLRVPSARQPLPRARSTTRDENLAAGDAALQRLYLALRGVDAGAELRAPVTASTARFVEAMDDDFNTPGAIAALQAAGARPQRRRRPRATALAGRGARRRRSAARRRDSALLAASGGGMARLARLASVRRRGGQPVPSLARTTREIERLIAGAHGGAPRAQLGRVRPHPRRAGAAGHRARGRRLRHDLAAEMTDTLMQRRG